MLREHVEQHLALFERFARLLLEAEGERELRREVFGFFGAEDAVPRVVSERLLVVVEEVLDFLLRTAYLLALFLFGEFGRADQREAFGQDPRDE